MTEPYQGFADQDWRCGHCHRPWPSILEAGKCCATPNLGEDQTALTIEELDEE